MLYHTEPEPESEPDLEPEPDPDSEPDLEPDSESDPKLESESSVNSWLYTSDWSSTIYSHGQAEECIDVYCHNVKHWICFNWEETLKFN